MLNVSIESSLSALLLTSWKAEQLFDPENTEDSCTEKLGPKWLKPRYPSVTVEVEAI